MQLNPDARRIASELDRERRSSGPRGPLHGIPILLKDNIDTADRSRRRRDRWRSQARRLCRTRPSRATARAGAVILGKANLSEWANFRGFGSSSGWSGVGASAATPTSSIAIPADRAPAQPPRLRPPSRSVSLGTETDGSVVCPSGQCGVAGIKPTVGLTSRAGVVPISDTQDTVGVHGRSVADAATVLGALTGVDSRDPKTAASAGNFHHDYRHFVNPDGLAGARIGVARQFTGVTTETDAVFEQRCR